MMKAIFFAYTPFQLMSSVAIKESFFKDDDTDIILADSIQARETYKENIAKTGYFKRVFLANILSYFPKKQNRIMFEKSRILSSIKPGYLADELNLKDSYDVFITTEINYYTESIFCILRKINKNISVELMDEGYASYSYYFREAYKPILLKNKIKNSVFRLLGSFSGRKYIAKEAKTIYLFCPELLCWEGMPYSIKKINAFDNNSFLNIVNRIFRYEEISEVNAEYRAKYIFFEECQYWDRRNNKDVKLIEHIANVVGKDEIVIKLHPRNEINRFQKMGYNTNKRYGIPWELIAINLDESKDYVFIAFSSGATLNYKFLSDKRFKTILLYKCVGDEYYKLDRSVKEWFVKFTSIYGESVFVPNNLEELDKILENL